MNVLGCGLLYIETRFYLQVETSFGFKLFFITYHTDYPVFTIELVFILLNRLWSTKHQSYIFISIGFRLDTYVRT